MRTLTPTEIQLALKRPLKQHPDGDAPDFTSADDSQERLRPSEMPKGQSEKFGQ